MEKKLSFSESIKEIYHGDRSGSGSHHVYSKHQRVLCFCRRT